MPTTSTPRLFHALANATRSGVSALHGGHHVAKTLTKVILPGAGCSCSVDPPSVEKARSGSGLPTVADGWRCKPHPAVARMTAATKAARNTRFIVFMRFVRGQP